jgi:cytochrome P450
MRRITLRVILRTALGLEPGPEMDCFERKMERMLANGRQRYALVLMTIVPIERLSGSRWVPMFRQLSDLDDDLFALIAARRRAGHRPGGENVHDQLAATLEDGSVIDDREVRDALVFLERKFGPHEWFPFGGGNRVCVGMPFALYEMKVVLAMLFSEVRLARLVSARSRPRRYGILLGPDDGARLMIS